MNEDVNGFEELGLNEDLMRRLDEMKFKEPFPIQEMAIGHILNGEDIIGQAKTGSGKTAAFGLPLLKLINTGSDNIQGLILAPTRELAVQITNDLRSMGKYVGVKVVTLYGGQSINRQLEELDEGPQIIVGTPGRIIDLLDHHHLDFGQVKHVVIDEADRMLDMGFIEDVEYILKRIPADRQINLFSATMPQEVTDLATKYMKNPKHIFISADEPSVDELDQYYAAVERDTKLERLLQVLEDETPSSCIIFCRTKQGARWLTRSLEKNKYNVVPLHGDLSQYQRDKSMQAFRNGRAQILVATDVAARGINVPNIELILNYDFPSESLMYFHRVGRTARAGKNGKSISFVTPIDYQVFEEVRAKTKAEIKPLSPNDKERIDHFRGYVGQFELRKRRYGDRHSFGDRYHSEQTRKIPSWLTQRRNNN
ncbi:MAG: DEAD/DEAH box helicase [Nitrososphaerota archaeon]|nr:DEAD/DEAH box helicase [Nitrososphaerota archaeon]